MVIINKIYTKNGDRGQTHLANGQITEKTNPRIELLAHLDSLMSELGQVIWLTGEEIKINQQLNNQFRQLLNRLFDQGAVLALAEKSADLLPQESEITILEKWIDDLNQELKPLENFVLPVGNQLISQLHRCRAQNRILEQKLWQFNQHETLDPHLLRFFNRLSDYIFVTIRSVTNTLNLPETVWQTGQKLSL